MTRRLEILAVDSERAIVETYIRNQRTSISAALPLFAARQHAEGVANGDPITDHTRHVPSDARERAQDRFRMGEFRV
jgi:hypothetical protein